MLKITIVVIITLIIIVGCYSVVKQNTSGDERDEEEKDESLQSELFPSGVWSECQKKSFTLDIRRHLGNTTPSYNGELFVTNDERNLYIRIILKNEDYNSIGNNGYDGIGDVFRIYIDCFNESYPYRYHYEDVKVLYTGNQDDCNPGSYENFLSLKGCIKDEQYLSINEYIREFQENGNEPDRESGSGEAISATFGLFGSSDYHYNGSIDFRATYNHTNPNENATGNYSVGFSIPLIGESYEGFPIDLVTKTNNTIDLKFQFIDAYLAGLGDYKWSYTLV